MASLAKIAVIFLLWATQTMLAGAAHAQGVDDRSLKTFLRSYIERLEDKSTRYSASPVTFDAEGRDILVYVTGRSWCGSAGCMALLLRPNDDSFKVITRFTLVRLPIMVLPSKTNGWHDLALSVAGGGVLPGRMAILKFDGHTYPNNPSMAPKLATDLAGAGTKVPLSEHGSLVY